jgi:hypothetical protein
LINQQLGNFKMSDNYDDSNDLGELLYYKVFGDHKQKDDRELPFVDLLEDDPEVRASKARLDAEVEKIAARRISQDAPAYDMLVKSRNQQINAIRKLHNIAVGETPDDFVAPDENEPSYAKPKAATGFAVVSKGRKRPATAPARAADPVATTPATASAKPASWLWGSK